MKWKPVEVHAHFVEEHACFVEAISQILMLLYASQGQKAVVSADFASTELLQNQGL